MSNQDHLNQAYYHLISVDHVGMPKVLIKQYNIALRALMFMVLKCVCFSCQDQESKLRK